MELWTTVNLPSDQRPISSGTTPEQTMLTIAEFRADHPHVPIEITDENGRVLINEARGN